MATLREIVYNIKNIAEGGASNETDSKISDRQVEFLVNTYRAQLLLQYTNAGRKIHPQTMQTFKFTEASDALSANYIELPAVVNFNGERAIKKITFLDNEATDVIYNIQHTTLADSVYNTGNKFTSGSKKAYIRDGRLYFLNFTLDATDYIEVTAVFADPREITTAEGAFDTDTTNYPLPTELINTLTQEILSKEYNVVVKTPRDKSIDGKTPTEKLQEQVR